MKEETNKMINEQYKKMLEGKSVIRQLSEFATARGKEIGYENVFDYSLGNPSVPVPDAFNEEMIHLIQTKSFHGNSRLQSQPWNHLSERKDCRIPEPQI